MNPPVPDELISAYFDGEVTADERVQVEQLLENSAELRQFLDDTSKLSALLHSFPRESAPDDLASNVQKRVNAAVVPASSRPQPVRRSLRREMTAFATGIMATIASLVAVYVSINHSPASFDRMYGSASGNLEKRAPQYEAPDGEIKVATIDGTAGKVAEPSVVQQDMLSSISNSSVSQELALRELEGMGIPDSSNLFFNGTRTEPIPPEELVKQLKTGDVYLRTFVDLNNTVMVVEFTVVDVEGGADGMQVVLRARNVPQVDGEQVVRLDEAAMNAKKDAAPVKRKRIPAKDHVVVFYVRAPGPELALALEDLQHRSDVYKNPEAQFPIPLPASVIAGADNIAANEALADAPVADKNSPVSANAVVEQQPVAVEANIAANLFANRNGMKIDDLDDDGENLDEIRTKTDPQELSKKEELASRDESKQVTAKSMLTRAMASKPNAIAAGVGQNTNATNPQSPQGYSLFRAAVDQRQLALRGGQQRQSNAQSNEFKGYSFQTPAISNTANPLANGNTISNSVLSANMPQLGNSGMIPQQNGIVSQNFARNNMSRQPATRANSDVRDPQLMRMLIVLKSAESPAQAPAP